MKCTLLPVAHRAKLGPLVAIIKIKVSVCSRVFDASVPFGRLLLRDGESYGDDILTGDRTGATICCSNIDGARATNGSPSARAQLRYWFNIRRSLLPEMRVHRTQWAQNIACKTEHFIFFPCLRAVLTIPSSPVHPKARFTLRPKARFTLGSKARFTLSLGGVGKRP